MVISGRLGDAPVETRIVVLVQKHIHVHFGTQWAPAKHNIHSYQAIKKWVLCVGAKTSSSVHRSKNIHTLVSCNTAKPVQINEKNCRRNGNITVFYSVNAGLTSVFPQKTAMMHKLDEYDIKAELCQLANT
jgi:hypothetical protein